MFQIVCDANNQILWVDERFPGGCHDSFVLYSSTLDDHANEGGLNGYWILGDSG